MNRFIFAPITEIGHHRKCGNAEQAPDLRRRADRRIHRIDHEGDDQAEQKKGQHRHRQNPLRDRIAGHRWQRRGR